jgi:hypothetical protein
MGHKYKIRRNHNVSKNLGGQMIRNIYKIGTTVGKATLNLSKDVGKDYLQSRTKKVIKDIYQDEDLSLLTNPEFIISGRKPPSSRKIYLLTTKNNKSKSKIGGKTKKRRYKRKYK